jgi:hypothetical protein
MRTKKFLDFFLLQSFANFLSSKHFFNLRGWEIKVKSSDRVFHACRRRHHCPHGRLRSEPPWLWSSRSRRGRGVGGGGRDRLPGWCGAVIPPDHPVLCRFCLLSLAFCPLPGGFLLRSRLWFVPTPGGEGIEILQYLHCTAPSGNGGGGWPGAWPGFFECSVELPGGCDRRGRLFPLS